MKQDELNINECLCDFEKTVINYNNQNFEKAFRGFNYFVNLKTNHTKLKKISVSSEIYLMRMYNNLLFIISDLKDKSGFCISTTKPPENLDLILS